MRTHSAHPAARTVEVELRQLTPQAERLLRERFGIGASAHARGHQRSAARRKRQRQLEATALRTLRLIALGVSPAAARAQRSA